MILARDSLKRKASPFAVLRLIVLIIGSEMLLFIILLLKFYPSLCDFVQFFFLFIV